MALCVFVKTKEPRIEGHFAKRGAEDLAQYVAKVRLVSEDIAAGKFYEHEQAYAEYIWQHPELQRAGTYCADAFIGPF